MGEGKEEIEVMWVDGVDVCSGEFSMKDIIFDLLVMH